MAPPGDSGPEPPGRERGEPPPGSEPPPAAGHGSGEAEQARGSLRRPQSLPGPAAHNPGDPVGEGLCLPRLSSELRAAKKRGPRPSRGVYLPQGHLSLPSLRPHTSQEAPTAFLRCPGAGPGCAGCEERPKAGPGCAAPAAVGALPNRLGEARGLIWTGENKPRSSTPPKRAQEQ